MEINNNGKQRDKHVKSESLKILIGGPFISGILTYYSYFNMQEWLEFFYACIPLFIGIHFLFFVYAPIRMLRFHNKTIEKISIMNDTIQIKTFAPWFMKSIDINCFLSNVTIKRSEFDRYGKKAKMGYTIKTKDKGEFYFVDDYFPDNTILLNHM
ncbi:hypothetical protein ACE1ET_20105 [Saccharicrinis sp. FJH62]|uniref:hypothetical protein n=1 Tax=Saccharicrinis sp. FJH62 TaxID=3344657 RepID=UPI0035D46269